MLEGYPKNDSHPHFWQWRASAPGALIWENTVYIYKEREREHLYIIYTVYDR